MIDFEEIPILEAARCVRLDFLSKTLGRVEVMANCPFCGDRKYHLFLNTRKNVYHCQRCKANGNSVWLYARLMNVDYVTAYNELINGGLYLLHLPKKPQEKAEREPKPLPSRHDAYYDLLSLLTLEDKHRLNLLERGLTEERIRRNMYRSVPMDNRRVHEVLATLSQKHDLAGIPGFYTRNGRWEMYRKNGFFIPVCTPEGYIQGLQIRLDGEDHRKYRWFSSRYEENGTRAYSWLHITGQHDAAPNGDCGRGTVVITEGALKADVAGFLSADALIIAVPGINCQKDLPDVLKKLNVSKVVEAFDMDKLDNPHVAQAVREIGVIVRKLGLSYLPYQWDAAYKGIDDYLLSRAA